MEETGHRLAVLDMGTNAIRFVLAEASDDGGYEVLREERILTRLGAGVEHSGFLSAEAMGRALAALRVLGEAARSAGVEHPVAVATSALREAENGREFLRRVQEEIGLAVQVLSSQAEGRLAFISAQRLFPSEQHQRVVVVDGGGGSTEVVVALGKVVERIHALPLGAVYLTERFLKTDPPSRRELRELRRHIVRQIRRVLGKEIPKAQLMIGSGGGITSLASMWREGWRRDLSTLRGVELQRGNIQQVLEVLTGKGLEERRAIPGLPPDRADIMVAGVMIVNELMRVLDINLLRVNDRGIRDGLLLDSLAGLARQSGTDDRLEQIQHFAELCRDDHQHAQHVALLALQLFDQLQRRYRLPRFDRHILEPAALLHDVGHYINFTRHHIHAYHLILHADLPAYSRGEIALIANVARYHRKASPKPKHPNLQELDEAGQALVKRLSAILRIADGLDRSRAQQVTSLCCRAVRGKLLIEVAATGDVEAELAAARDKARLFQQVFGREVIFVQRQVPAQTPAVVGLVGMTR